MKIKIFQNVTVFAVYIYIQLYLHIALVSRRDCELQEEEEDQYKVRPLIIIINSGLKAFR